MHAARQPRSWLIFDVSQSKGRDAIFTGGVGRSACFESGSICGSLASVRVPEKKVRGVRFIGVEFAIENPE